MENNFTGAMIARAKSAKSAEELALFAKENGVELTQEQAQAYFAKLHASGELADEELDAVAGGGCGGNDNDACEGDRVTILRHKKMKDGSSHVGHTGVFSPLRTGLSSAIFFIECDCGAKVTVNDKRNDIKKL